jgi:F0F1-type ATP synthase delta subunit
MEEKIKQIQTYLSSKANPIVQPMLEQMAKERPEKVLPWMQAYINKKMRTLFHLFRITSREIGRRHI